MVDGEQITGFGCGGHSTPRCANKSMKHVLMIVFLKLLIILGPWFDFYSLIRQRDQSERFITDDNRAVENHFCYVTFNMNHKSKGQRKHLSDHFLGVTNATLDIYH